MKTLLTMFLLVCCSIAQASQDYAGAYRDAKQGRKLFVIWFSADPPTEADRTFESRVLTDTRVRTALRPFAFCRADLKLVGNPAFAEMHGTPGLAIVDFTCQMNDPLYGTVTSAFPFTATKSYSPEAVLTMLSLPAGCSITQRSMVYAVRVHPERPAGTDGQPSPVLFREAKGHAQYMANVCVQGHQHWDQRFRNINAQLPNGLLAQEIVAESWGGDPLIDACVECVHSWRQSPGHWGALRARQSLFGFDIKQGRNGLWYGCGIFGNHGG